MSPSKTCSKCKEELPLEKFWKDPSKKDGRSSQCAKCKHAAKSASPTEKVTRLTRVQVNQAAKKAYARKVREETACADCGRYGLYYCMDFDHTSSMKNFDVSRGLSNTRISLQRLIDEIALCEVVCAYCHRIRTHNQGYRRNI